MGDRILGKVVLDVSCEDGVPYSVASLVAGFRPSNNGYPVQMGDPKIVDGDVCIEVIELMEGPDAIGELIKYLGKKGITAQRVRV